MPEIQPLVNLHTLWPLLTPQDQLDACRIFWGGRSENQRKDQRRATESIRRALNLFHDREVEIKPPVWKAKTLSQCLGRPEFEHLLEPVLREFLLERRREMICAILDAEGTPHSNGFIAEDAPVPEVEAFLRGLKAVLGRYSPQDLMLYYGYQLVAGASEHWAKLPEALHFEPFKSLLIDACAIRPSTLRPATEHESPIMDATPPDESSEEFSTLDNLLIKTIVAGTGGILGAYAEDQLQDLVHELLALSHERHKSHFHLGFLHAVLKRDYVEELPASNTNRRGWYLTGYLMGRLRGQHRAAIIEFIKEKSSHWDELLREGSKHAVSMLLRPLAELFAEADELRLLEKLLKCADFPPDQPRTKAICNTCFEKAADLIRRDRHTEAVPILAALIEKLETPRGIETSFRNEFLGKCKRKRGQAELRSGRFPQAAAWLEDALDGPPFSQAANACADLGLAKANFRSLRYTLPVAEEKEEQLETKIRALESVEEYFHRASGCENSDPTNALFVLGWIRLFRKKPQEAEEYLARAYEGMLRVEEAYQTEYLVDWARLLLAIAIAERADQARLNEMREHVERAIASPYAFPLSLWKRLCDSLVYYDDHSLLEKVITHLLDRRHAGHDLLRESGLMQRSKPLRVNYRKWLDTKAGPPAERMRELAHLLDLAFETGEYEEAAELLDALEGTVRADSSLIPGFIAKLEDSRDRLLAVWDEYDLCFAVSGLSEQIGQLDQAATKLLPVFHRACSEGNAQLAGAVLRQLDRLRSTSIDLTQLQSRYDSLFPSAAGEAAAAGAQLGCRVLYVGGNEIQMQYEQNIRNHLQLNAPWVEVEFYYPGWDSNWSYHLDRVRGMLPHAHVVVINSLVRTQFGRELRRQCGSNGNPPWLPCTGRGRDSIQSAILHAAAWAHSRKGG